MDFNLPSNWWVSQIQKSEFAVLGFEKLGLGLDNCKRTTKNAYCHIYSLWFRQHCSVTLLWMFYSRGTEFKVESDCSQERLYTPCVCSVHSIAQRSHIRNRRWMRGSEEPSHHRSADFLSSHPPQQSGPQAGAQGYLQPQQLAQATTATTAPSTPAPHRRPAPQPPQQQQATPRPPSSTGQRQWWLVTIDLLPIWWDQLDVFFNT